MYLLRTTVCFGLLGYSTIGFEPSALALASAKQSSAHLEKGFQSGQNLHELLQTYLAA